MPVEAPSSSSTSALLLPGVGIIANHLSSSSVSGIAGTLPSRSRYNHHHAGVSGAAGNPRISTTAASTSVHLNSRPYIYRDNDDNGAPAPLRKVQGPSSGTGLFDTKAGIGSKTVAKYGAVSLSSMDQSFNNKENIAPNGTPTNNRRNVRIPKERTALAELVAAKKERASKGSKSRTTVDKKRLRSNKPKLTARLR